jgi:hypothetical protein
VNNSGGGGKILPTRSLKSRPYELSRPVIQQQRADDETAQLIALDATAAKVTNNQNALLARLTSLSSSFKSIFVRPKSARHVSYDRFANKSVISALPSTINEKRETEFKLRLFSTNNEIITKGIYNILINVIKILIGILIFYI